MLRSAYENLLRFRLGEVERQMRRVRLRQSFARGAEMVACAAELRDLEMRRRTLIERLAAVPDEPAGLGMRLELRRWVNQLGDSVQDWLTGVEAHYGEENAPESRREERR